MREHLGVDVDAMYEEDLMASEPVKPPHEQEEWDPDVEEYVGQFWKGVERPRFHIPGAWVEEDDTSSDNWDTSTGNGSYSSSDGGWSDDED